MTKKKIIIYVLVTFISLLAIFGIFKLYQYIRIKTAKIEIVLKDDLTLEFNYRKRARNIDNTKKLMYNVIVIISKWKNCENKFAKK